MVWVPIISDFSDASTELCDAALDELCSAVTVLPQADSSRAAKAMMDRFMSSDATELVARRRLNPAKSISSRTKRTAGGAS